MTSSGLLNEIKTRPIVLAAVITFHLVLIVLLSINLNSNEVHKPASSNKKTVKAFVVDVAKIEAEAKKRKQEKDAKKNKIKREQEKVKKALATEKKRLANIKKKQADEKKRLADLKKKNLAEKKRLLAEKNQAAEDKKKKQAQEAKRQADEESRRREVAAELQRQLAAEERQEAEAQQAAKNNARLQSLRAQYVRLIEQKVKRNWLRPATSTSSMSCEVIVTQTSLGDVVGVSLGKCVNDVAFQRSIERAVRKASPLPPPPDPRVFDREIHFTFKPRS